MNVWQIACGAPGRDFRQIFLGHDLMLIGPGDPGEFDRSEYKVALKAEWISKSQFAQVRSFVENPKTGDLVLLRFGHSVIRAGLIAEAGYHWDEAFDDVLGWDLQHSRRVIWGAPEAIDCLRPIQPVFSNYKQQPTFTAVREQRFDALVPKIFEQIRGRPLKPLPVIPKVMTLEEFGTELFEGGLGNDAVERAIDAIEKARRLGHWYAGGLSGRQPSEHEIIAHTTIPLMLALGWSEQLLGVEWDRIDLAFFDRTPTGPENCVMICEAKTPHKPLELALDQAVRYVKTHHLTRCRKILLSSGTRLVTYARTKSDKWVPDGYANLMKLRSGHAGTHKASAVETLMHMVPARIAHSYGRADI